jgi:tRNA A37 threonylcarbamoyladenosine synthetase subunit TsaC/SUA5/YrdC
MGRPKKKEIALSTDSFLGVAQEAYNELVEQRITAIRQINENKKKVDIEDMHDLVNLNKANTDLLKLIDNTIDKKLSLVKLLSTLVFKGDGNDTKVDGSLTPEDMELLRDMFTKKDGE